MDEYVYTANGAQEKITSFFDSFWPEGTKEWDWKETLKRARFEHAFSLGEDLAALQIEFYVTQDPAPAYRYYAFAGLNYGGTGSIVYFMFMTPLTALDFLRKYAPTARTINKIQDEQEAVRHGQTR
jgi:hypothetical protein